MPLEKLIKVTSFYGAILRIATYFVHCKISLNGKDLSFFRQLQTRSCLLITLT